MSHPLDYDFDEALDLLYVRLLDAEAIDDGQIHDFDDLMSDQVGELPDIFYRQAFEEMQARGHLNPGTAGVTGGPHYHGQLSADGRLYARDLRD